MALCAERTGDEARIGERDVTSEEVVLKNHFGIG